MSDHRRDPHDASAVGGRQPSISGSGKSVATTGAQPSPATKKKKRRKLSPAERRALYEPTTENAGAGWKGGRSLYQHRGNITHFDPLAVVDDEEPQLGYPKGPRNPLR